MRQGNTGGTNCCEFYSSELLRYYYARLHKAEQLGNKNKKDKWFFV